MYTRHFVLVLSASVLLACGASQPPAETTVTDAEADDTTADTEAATDIADADTGAPVTLRVATFNTSLYGDAADEIADRLETGEDAHASCVAAIIAEVQPDVVLINELDYDEAGRAATALGQFFAQAGWALDHAYVAPSNTGLPSGHDLDRSGEVGTTVGEVAYGNDALGFGRYPGQYGFAVFSRYPIALEATRTFQTLRWRDMPGALLPDDVDTVAPADWYSAEALDVMRLSSKNHADVTVDVDGHALHVLASHPTPPSFDGDEDRNGRRNHDEIRFWVDYIGAGDGSYIVDDGGAAGGLPEGSHFVIVGDLNADPIDGTGRQEAIRAMLETPLTIDPQPTSEGAVEDAARDGGLNAEHTADPAVDTGDFNDEYVGNLRIDYAVPSSTVDVVGAGVFWPREGEPLADCAAVSDHHLVWVDIVLGD